MNKLKLFISALLALACMIFIVFIVLVLVYQHSVQNVSILITSIFLFDAVFGFYVLNSNRYPNTKISWIFVFLFIPLVGPLLFLIFGVNPFYKKHWRQHNKDQKDFLQYEDFTFTEKFLKSDMKDELTFNFALVHSLRPIYKFNDIKIIKSNIMLYEESIKLIRKAKNHIHIEMYILADGFWLRTIATELIIKARSGVHVRILYDWVGSYKRLPKKLLKELKKNGVEIGVFNPKGFNMFKGATNFRGHRKSIVVDNRLSIYGGSNIGDEYLSMSDKYNSWCDFNMIIEGQIVNTINGLFCGDWLSFTNWTTSKQQKQNLKNDFSQIFKKPTEIESNAVAQLVESNPDYHTRLLKNVIMESIYNAKTSIKIVTPYFMPTDDIIEALAAAIWKGVKISIVVPGDNDDKNFVQLMNRSSYKKLVEKGVKVYEYDGFIHSKYMVIDNRKIISGSCNLDYRSLFLNFESSLLIDSITLSKQIEDDMNRVIKNSREITTSTLNVEFKKIDTIKIWFLSVFYPLL